MGLLAWLLRRPTGPETIQSDFKSLESASTALQSTSLQDKLSIEPAPLISMNSPPIHGQFPIEKDSFGIGLAAGFTGKTLKEIEYSLSRIETQMTTRDWFLANFEDKTPELIEMVKLLDRNQQQRFESIQSSIEKLKGMSQTLPEPYKTSISTEISAIEANLPLTPKMEEALNIIKQTGEISYEDLARRLNLTEVSGLRGMMANMCKRTKDIERFSKGGKGWVRFVGKDDLNRMKSDLKQGESALSQDFEAFLGKQGFQITRKFYQTSPDFIIQKDGRSIGVELKIKSDANSLQKGLGQLIFAKSAYNLDEIWLVMPSHQSIPEEYIKIIKDHNIKVFILDKETLLQL